ncbi:hypothetical protein HS960_14680 [Sphingobacterium paramultivorum]|uniref:Uncharacterized protein n=1 Tax=Sphingobacterium paramultivorum TaxID=2886510 RepID=A0A7G5E4A0_9SPHI|nr:hypothetical protein [Sphingobacterium paramultivorum]QMV68825.1 hypothetical protein HS960_14680 [Sphingobacterium paramultivorum]WSO12592.1 hypothetical protein VUL84_14670 [Sphingobacterium paramultivorum]
MDIKKHLLALKSFEDSLAQALDQLQREVGNDLSFLENFDKLNNCYKMDSRSSQLLLRAMQLSKSEDIYSSFELSDIEKAYDFMLETNTNNLNIWVDAIYFNEIVIDNKRKSELLKTRFCSLLANFQKEIENLDR